MVDLLLTNGTIHTLDAKHPRAHAMAIAGGRVVAFDADAQAQRTRHTEVIDLRGRAVVPGPVDHHIHFTGYALGLARVQLEGAHSIEEAVARVAARVQTVQPGEWILGLGWNHLDWAPPVFPTKEPLDRVAPNNPVALDRKDGHSVWLNSAALRAARITRETPNPTGGVIDRDADGEPTGLLREKAAWLLDDLVQSDSVHPEQLLTAIQNAHRVGLTGIHNVESAGPLRAFQDLHAQGKLTLRVVHMLPADNLDHAIAVGLRTGWGDEWLRLGGVKIFADGSLGSQTARMLEAFEDQPDNCGVAVTPPEEIERKARAAAQAGIMVLTHAIGDRAIRDVLDVYAKLRAEGLTETTLRIEHVQHLHPADLPRFSALNVVASVQPIHATSDYKMADRLVGARARYTYAFKSLLNAGANVIFGSDCPVETLDPLVGIHAAVTRERANGEPRGGWYPVEKLTVEEALRAYAAPLRAAGDGEEEAGALGDCLVLSQDIFAIPPAEILNTRVDCTVVGGKIVYAG